MVCWDIMVFKNVWDGRSQERRLRGDPPYILTWLEAIPVKERRLEAVSVLPFHNETASVLKDDWSRA